MVVGKSERRKSGFLALYVSVDFSVINAKGEPL
jgi:hypothetical protein